MKSLRKMTYGKAKNLRLEVSEAWNNYQDQFREPGWLEKENDLALIQHEEWVKHQRSIGQNRFCPFVPITKDNVFDCHIITADSAYKDHDSIRFEEYSVDEVFTPLNTENVVAFVRTPESFQGAYLPIFTYDTPHDVKAKISCCKTWTSSDEISGYPNPFVCKGMFPGWSTSVDRGSFFVETPAGTSIEFDLYTKYTNYHNNFSSRIILFEIDGHTVSFNNNETHLLVPDQQKIELPIALFAFITANSNFDKW